MLPSRLALPWLPRMVRPACFEIAVGSASPKSIARVSVATESPYSIVCVRPLTPSVDSSSGSRACWAAYLPSAGITSNGRTVSMV